MEKTEPRMKKILMRAWDNAADFFFPNRCPSCGGFIPYYRYFCDECIKKLEFAEFCPVCGHNVCECSEHDTIYDGCATLLPYTGVARDGILALKYRSGLNTAKLFVPKLYKKLDDLGYIDADIITAVPMTRKRRRLTGYNHAEYIAKKLSQLCGIPTDFRLIGRVETSSFQHDLTREERIEAAKRAYVPGRIRDLSGKRVILCDDIITTGSTLNACAEVLKGMGAKKVYCGVLAGTFKEKEKEK